MSVAQRVAGACPVRRSFDHRVGQLVPPEARALRAGAVRLKPGAVMDWHSTRMREELVLVLSGAVELETSGPARAAAGGPHSRARRLRLKAGQCAFLPSRLLHRVVNRSRAQAAYLYVTAPLP